MTERVFKNTCITESFYFCHLDLGLPGFSAVRNDSVYKPSVYNILFVIAAQWTKMIALHNICLLPAMLTTMYMNLQLQHHLPDSESIS